MQKLKSVVSSLTTTRTWPFRPTRVLRPIKTIIAVAMVIILFTTALTIADNALTPAIELTHVASGPAALSVVRALEMDTKTGDLYAGSNGGVFKSIDGGVTWQPASHGLSGIDIQDLLYDKDHDVMYTVVFGGGLFRSSNHGESWQQLGGGMRGDKLLTIAVDPRVPVMYAGMLGYGMYTSIDQGATWQTIGPGVSNTYVHQFLLGDEPGEVYVATDSGLWHSTNVTETWDLLTSNTSVVSVISLLRDVNTGIILAGTDHGILQIAKQGSGFTVNLTGLTDGNVQALVQDRSDGMIYAATLDGIMKSRDGAATWVRIDQGLSSTLVHSLLLKPDGTGLLAATSSGIFMTSDGGAHWQSAEQNPNARHVQTLLVNPQDGALYAGLLGGGVFHSTENGANWTPINTGLPNAVVQSLGIDHGTNTLYAGTRSGLYRTALDKINWTLATPKAIGQDIQTIAVDDRHGNAYAVTANGDVLRSTSDGASWTIVQPLQTVFARTVAVSSHDSAVYAGAYKGGVLVSNDFGFTWSSHGGRLPDNNVETLAVDERDGTVYAGTLSGGVYRMVNGGWEQMAKNLPGNIIALAVDERYGGVFAAVKSGLFRMGNADQYWSQAIGGMYHNSILSVVYDRVAGALYAGTMAGGAYRSTDSGVTWKPVSNGLTDIEFLDIAIEDASGLLSAAATDRGIFQSDDAGQTWRAANVGLGELTVRGLTSNGDNATPGLNLRTDHITVIPLDASYNKTKAVFTPMQYVVSNGSAAWQERPANIGNVLDLFLPINTYGVAGRLPSGDIIWALHGGGEIMARTLPGVSAISGAIRILPDGRSQMIAAWGAEITQSEPGITANRVPLVWMLLRIWSWQQVRTLNALTPLWWSVMVALFMLLAALVAASRLRLSRSFGVPLAIALFKPWRSMNTANKTKLDAHWPRWEKTIQRQLFAYGDVTPEDVPSIPGPFRQYAIQRYEQKHAGGQAVRMEGQRLHAAGRVQMRRWASAWRAMTTAMLREGAVWTNRKHVAQLDSSFAASLDLELMAGIDVDAVRIYATKATRASKLNRPIALLFLADNEALKRSVKNLTDAMDKLDGAMDVGMAQHPCGIVIALGRPGRNVDIAPQIALAVTEAGDNERFTVLNGNEVSAMMSAAEPALILNAHINAMKRRTT